MKDDGNRQTNVYSNNGLYLGTIMGQIIGVTLLALTMLYASSSMAQDSGVSGELQRYAETSDDEKDVRI